MKIGALFSTSVLPVRNKTGNINKSCMPAMHNFQIAHRYASFQWNSQKYDSIAQK